MEKKTPPSKSTFEDPVTENLDTEKQMDKEEPTNSAGSSFKSIKLTWVACPWCLCHGQKCCRSVFD